MAAKKNFDIVPPGETEKEHGKIAATTTLNNPAKPQMGERRQLGIRISKADFEDLESLRMKWTLERKGIVMNDELSRVIHEYVQNHRAEIDEFRQTISSYDKR